MFTSLIIIFLVSNLLISSVFSLTSTNLIFSVFLLILTSLSGLCIFPFLQAEYLLVIFLIVYLGAIVVSFPFVITLLNINTVLAHNFNVSVYILSLLLFSYYLYIIYQLFFLEINLFPVVFYEISTSESLTNAERIGLYLFSDFGFTLVVSGLLMMLVTIIAFLILEKTK